MNSDVIQCADFKFKKLYTRAEIDEQVDRIAQQVDGYFQAIAEKDPEARFVVLGILNGAFMFVSELVKRLKTKVLIDFIRVQSYKGTVSGNVQIITPINQKMINGSYLLIVDDICDSGKTLAQLGKLFQTQYKAIEIKFATLIIRPDKQHAIVPDFSGLKCSEFIVGCGLDYSQQGRQFPEIYQKIDE